MITGDHLERALVGVTPGWYPLGELLARYREWAEREGLPSPALVVFSRALRDVYNPEVKTSKGRRLFWLTDEILKGEGWYKATTTETPSDQ